MPYRVEQNNVFCQHLKRIADDIFVKAKYNKGRVTCKNSFFNSCLKWIIEW